jgi:hypothetical protein
MFFYFPACHRSYARYAACWILFVALAIAFVPWPSAIAQVPSYWLRQGGGVVGACAGKTQGEPMQTANKGAAWVLITGVVTCRDEGANYSFEVNFLRVEINPSVRTSINRDTLDFDWIGLAVFRPQGNGAQIEWLYDEALPIEGSLEKTSRDKVYFGNLKFTVPKSAIGRATNFLFYMTSHGPLYHFELL